MPNPTKDDQHEIATKCGKGMAYKKKNTDQNSGRTAGRSRNPGGRPQRDIAAEIARAIFEKNPELIERYSRRLRRGAQGRRELMAVWPEDTHAMKSSPVNT